LPGLYPRVSKLVPMLRWLGLALLGILVAAGISIAASRLASQQIGLASEPISAGDALAPAAPAEEAPDRKSHQQAGGGRTAPAPRTAPPPAVAPPPRSSSPAPPETTPAPPSGSDDSGGAGSGESGGGGADD
jgi:hypothetical protein